MVLLLKIPDLNGFHTCKWPRGAWHGTSNWEMIQKFKVGTCTKKYWSVIVVSVVVKKNRLRSEFEVYGKIYPLHGVEWENETERESGIVTLPGRRWQARKEWSIYCQYKLTKAKNSLSYYSLIKGKRRTFLFDSY